MSTNQPTNPQPDQSKPLVSPPLIPENMKGKEDYRPLDKKAGVLSILEALLKYPKQVIFQLHSGNRTPLLISFFGIIAICMLIYGIIIGSFSAGNQLWAAPLKLTLGTFFSALICLPSLYIFSCLSGLDVKLSEICGLLFANIALSSTLLIGFAPIAWVFSQSTNSIVFMSILHLMFWVVGTYFGLRLLYKGLAYFKAGNVLNENTPNGILRLWEIIFILVCFQMTTALRPIIGTADSFLPKEKKFFLVHWKDCLK